MCGKFTQMVVWQNVTQLTHVMLEGQGEPIISTPVRDAYVICLDENGARKSTPMRWGFVDDRPGATDAPRHIHARAETVDRLPTFVDSFRERRGILLVHTFNEGEEVPVHYEDGTPAGRTWTRQWTVSASYNSPIAIAVIWETAIIRGVETPTFVQVTTPANTLLATITDRMPAILQPSDWEVWLGETRASLDEIKALLRPNDDRGMWRMSLEDPAKRPPRTRRPGPHQPSLF